MQLPTKDMQRKELMHPLVGVTAFTGTEFSAAVVRGQQLYWAGRKLLCGGGGVTRKPIFPTPPPLSLAAVTGGGGSGQGCPTCQAGGGGGQPNIYGSK